MSIFFIERCMNKSNFWPTEAKEMGQKTSFSLSWKSFLSMLFDHVRPIILPYGAKSLLAKEKCEVNVRIWGFGKNAHRRVFIHISKIYSNNNHTITWIQYTHVMKKSLRERLRFNTTFFDTPCLLQKCFQALIQSAFNLARTIKTEQLGNEFLII